MRIGIAVGPDGLTGVLLGRGARTEPVEVPFRGGDGPEAAVTELRRRVEARVGRSTEGARAAVALLPPLAEVRGVSLPPVTAAEAEAVLRRDASRYFMEGNGPRTVGVWRTGRRGGWVLAAASSTGRLEALRMAVEAAGWRLQVIVPATAAWWVAGRGRRGRTPVAAVHGVTVHVLRAEADGVTLRRLPLDRPDEVAGALGPGERAAVVGDPGARGLATTLSNLGVRATSRPELGATAAEVAACHAGGARPELVPPSLAEERRRRARTGSLAMLAGAAALVVAAAGVQLWGTHRELRAVTAARAELAARVAPLLSLRDSLERVDARVRAVAEAAGAAPAWTGAFVDVARHLPRDAHLTALLARGETLEMEAAGAAAGRALESLREAGSLRDVRLDGPVEREMENGQTAVERFRIRARLAPPARAPGEGGLPSGGEAPRPREAARPGGTP